MSKTKSSGSTTKGRGTKVNEGSYYDIAKGTKPVNRPKK